MHGHKAQTVRADPQRSVLLAIDQQAEAGRGRLAGLRVDDVEKNARAPFGIASSLRPDQQGERGDAPDANQFFHLPVDFPTPSVTTPHTSAITPSVT